MTKTHTIRYTSLQGLERSVEKFKDEHPRANFDDDSLNSARALAQKMDSETPVDTGKPFPPAPGISREVTIEYTEDRCKFCSMPEASTAPDESQETLRALEEVTGNESVRGEGWIAFIRPDIALPLAHPPR